MARSPGLARFLPFRSRLEVLPLELDFLAFVFRDLEVDDVDEEVVDEVVGEVVGEEVVGFADEGFLLWVLRQDRVDLLSISMSVTLDWPGRENEGDEVVVVAVVVVEVVVVVGRLEEEEVEEGGLEVEEVEEGRRCVRDCDMLRGRMGHASFPARR